MSENPQAYCFSCKTKRPMDNATAVYTKTGAPGTSGVCSVCGTKMFKTGRTEAHDHIPPPENVEKPKRKKSKSKSKKKSKRSKFGNVDKLVVVESPAKARTVGRFLGKEYTVLASKGHVRDLPKSRLSVNTKEGFTPTYRVSKEKRAVVNEIKDAASNANEIYLATDPDREGEAIAWHLIAASKMDEDKIRRVVFHEVTDGAVQEAFDNPRSVNMDLVNAQQARRILDRLVGYSVSQLLWGKVRRGLSAGRVQSVALRIVVEREKEIEAFVPEEYWSIEAQMRKQDDTEAKASFIAKLHKINGENPILGSEDDVRPHLEVLEKSQYLVQNIKRGTRQRKPSPPFTTSTLQQEASRRHGYSTRRTMSLAQQLYEGIQETGLITYMRTDSVSVSEKAQNAARQFVTERYGKEYIPEKPNRYKTKAKSAQEAHEAIRPTDVNRIPDSLKGQLNQDQYRLYKLIWQRFVASQMSPAVYNTIRIDIHAGLQANDMPYLFRATGSTIKFMGYLAVYQASKDEDATQDSDEGLIFPDLEDNELLTLMKLLPEQHFTQPPPRYTEASLVRALEEYQIGRPSTFAPTVAIIQERDYVSKENKRLIPNEIGRTVNDLLVEYFPDELDYQFTAKLEDQLDDIATGKMQWQPMLETFYDPFQGRLENARENMPVVRKTEYVGRDCPVCSNELVYRHGRWGRFIGCSNYPECKHTEQIIEKANVVCPQCGQEHGGELIVRKTRKGRTFYGCSRYPDCDYATWQLPKKKEGEQSEEPAQERSAS